MKLPSSYVQKTSRANGQLREDETGNGKMLLVLRRRYAYLHKTLEEAFRGQEDVEVLVDRREGKHSWGKRRKGGSPVLSECHQMDRRKRKEEVLEVILSS